MTKNANSVGGEAYATRLKNLVLMQFCFLASCVSTSYRYVVSDVKNPAPKQTSEATYAEPADQPQGDVRVRSLGVVDLRAKGKATRIPSLHIRMTLALNQNAKQAWAFDSEQQKVSFVNGGDAAPLFANSNATTLPTIEIKPGELRAVDLYYALPSGAPAEVPEFAINWVIESNSTKIAESTRFERAAVPEPYPAVYPYDPYPVGYGPIWWEGAPSPIVVGAPVRIRN